MNGQIKIIIVEDNIYEVRALKACAKNDPSLIIVASANNESDAITYVQDYLPNAIILDLELHDGGGDGLSFLTELKKLCLPIDPYILVTTNNTSKTIHDHIRDDVDFIMSKRQINYCAEAVIAHIVSMRDSIIRKNLLSREHCAAAIAEADSPACKSRRLMERLSNEFDLLEMGHKLSGRRYLIEAIVMMAETCCSDKDAVIRVAKKSKKTYEAAYQAMSNSIKKTWSSTDTDTLYKYFTGHVRSSDGAPTVAEFIYYYYDKLRILY